MQTESPGLLDKLGNLQGFFFCLNGRAFSMRLGGKDISIFERKNNYHTWFQMFLLLN